jgi:ADP-heptose:LPS heptosyltransferase
MEFQRIKKIICIKLWGLGNLVVIDPLLCKIKERFPNAHLTFITFDSNKGFLERNKAIDRIIYFKLTTNIFYIIKGILALTREARAQRIDLVINFETFNRASALFSYLTRAPLRIGPSGSYEKDFYTHSSDDEKIKHIFEIFFSRLKPLGINSSYQYRCFSSWENDRSKIESILKDYNVGEFICIHPGTSTNFLGKRWPEGYFAALTDMLIGAYDIPVLFTGTRKEQSAVRRIMAQISHKGKIFDLTGRLTVWELTELLRKSRLFIANDTGPVHLAASLGINVAAIYGPTAPQRFGPLNENSVVFYQHRPCSPCVGINYVNKRCRQNFKCLDFSSQTIFNGISEKFFNAQRN